MGSAYTNHLEAETGSVTVQKRVNAVARHKVRVLPGRSMKEGAASLKIQSGCPDLNRGPLRPEHRQGVLLEPVHLEAVVPEPVHEILGAEPAVDALGELAQFGEPSLDGGEELVGRALTRLADSPDLRPTSFVVVVGHRGAGRPTGQRAPHRP